MKKKVLTISNGTQTLEFNAKLWEGKLKNMSFGELCNYVKYCSEMPEVTEQDHLEILEIMKKNKILR